MSEVPVLWEAPSPHPEGPIGGFVLFQDGHVEWLRYPSKFPMTEAFMTRLEALREP
jgi:prepilin-type processing-associated H-X9-DG protein